MYSYTGLREAIKRPQNLPNRCHAVTHRYLTHVSYLKPQIWYQTSSIFHFDRPLFFLHREGTPSGFQMHSFLFNSLSYCRLEVKYCKPWIRRKYELFSNISSVVELMQRRQAEMLMCSTSMDRKIPIWRFWSSKWTTRTAWEQGGRRPTVVEANPSETTRELAARFEVTIPTILSHLKAIGKVKKLDRWVQHELSERQQRNRFEACCSLVSRLKGDPVLHRIVTCGEKWIVFDKCKRSAQRLDNDEAPKHTPKPSVHGKELTVSVRWSSAGVVHYSSMRPGQLITADLYCEQFEEIMRLQIKQPRLVNRDRRNLQQDNVEPHVAGSTLLELQELDLETLCHPPYSPISCPRYNKPNFRSQIRRFILNDLIYIAPVVHCSVISARYERASLTSIQLLKIRSISFSFC